MYDIFFLGDSNSRWENFKSRYPKSQLVNKQITISELKSKTFTSMFWVVRDDFIVNENFNLDSYRVTKWDDKFVHVFKNRNFYDGLCLIPKSLNISNKEFDHRFFVDKKQIDIIASNPVPFQKFYIDSYEEYLNAADLSSTDMFWAIWNDIIVEENFDFTYYVPYYDSFHRNITHVFKNHSYYDGVCLFSKKTKVSKKEIKYRFFTEKKEIDIISSHPKPYDRFVIDTYEDYLKAKELSSTEMFWVIGKEIEITNNDIFDIYFSHHNFYDRNENHVFKHRFRNEDTYNGVMLLSKNKPLTAKEINYRFLIEKKQHEVLASKMKPYDIVFISYNESNADENYEVLLKRFPRSKRIHGVKGIHQAHIEAAKLVESGMFWVVDGDAAIEETFNFDYEVSRYELDIVHVWKSRNPINDLIYGYGGVKLLPKNLTLSMDVNSADMTTSISKRFKPMPDVSNLTSFDTDPFNTWKSAFRECVKLSSKTISGQLDKETEERLDIWCSIGKDKKFGNYAIDGAIEGRRYGEENKSNIESLKKINDFEWLKFQFDRLYG
jgi:hypothetical protein